jgi:hypothetical protein
LKPARYPGCQIKGGAWIWKQLGPAERADFYAAQDEIGKTYIALSTHKADGKRLHPLVRSRNAIQAINIMRREMASGQLRDRFGG